jgi:DNA primase large subunit
MSKHIISQDTPVAQLEQMVYDALTEINENMTNVAECNSMGDLYDMVMSGFTVYDEDVVTIEMVKRIREEWVSDMQEIEQFDSTEVIETPAVEVVAEQDEIERVNALLSRETVKAVWSETKRMDRGQVYELYHATVDAYRGYYALGCTDVVVEARIRAIKQVLEAKRK